MFKHPPGSPDLVRRKGLNLNHTNEFRSASHQYFHDFQIWYAVMFHGQLLRRYFGM
jgi:hypothetical protein